MREGYIHLRDIYISPDVERLVHSDDVQTALQRHERCDWGDSSLYQAILNDNAVRDGGWIIAVYHDRYGKKFIIDTGRQTCVTTEDWKDRY